MTKSITWALLPIVAALGWAPMAGADPTAGHYTIVRSQSPSITCVVASDDIDPGIGPNVVCQAGNRQGFPGSPTDPESAMHLHQAIVTAAGKLTYRDANIPMGGDDFNPTMLSSGNVLRFQDWTITPTGDDVTFVNDATGHGMTVATDQNVTAF